MTNTPRWAALSGVAGLVANALLILFFALYRPWAGESGEFAWLGPANDAAVVVQFAALVPVALATHVALAGRVGRGLTAAAVAAMVFVAVLQLALLADLLAFEVQVWAVLVCLAVVFGWVLTVSRAGRDVLAPRAIGLGFVSGAGFLAGVAVAGLGLLVPDGPARAVLWAAAGLAGFAAWLAFPGWTLAVSPALARRVPARAGAVAR
jgi:hypothetical protein